MGISLIIYNVELSISSYPDEVSLTMAILAGMGITATLFMFGMVFGAVRYFFDNMLRIIIFILGITATILGVVFLSKLLIH